MVINARVGEWCSRLFELHRLTQQEPDGPKWLWRIRIKILNFLVARYSDEPIAKTPAADEPKRRADTVASPPPLTMLDRPLPEVQYPPRRAQIVRPVLDEIHTLNDKRRVSEGFYPEPAVLWEWWRQTQCARP